ncbi:MAG: DUF924 family protein [Lysobacteraceae bacterium]
MTPAIHEVIGFWRDAGAAKWFVRDDALDAVFRERFLDAHHQAARRELEDLAQSADGALALLILLDQFPRNCFRDSAHAYATDGLARHHATRAIDAGFDRQVDPSLRLFFYLPFEHSEDNADQQRAVALCEQLGDANYLKYAELHRDIIARFGRFPHRNHALGRETTDEEQVFLDAGGFNG